MPGAIRVHLDTDLGGDPDDACALAMLLGWPGVEITAITTTADRAGWRAAYVAHCLQLAGRGDVPITAGAGCSLTTQAVAEPVIGDPRHWPLSLTPCSSPPGAALDLLARSAASGATIIAIGPYTNLALLEIARPGTLRRAPLVLMGGYVTPPGPGLPPWGPELDFNVQWDPRAAEIVCAASDDLTLEAEWDLGRYRRGDGVGRQGGRRREWIGGIQDQDRGVPLSAGWIRVAGLGLVFRSTPSGAFVQGAGPFPPRAPTPLAAKPAASVFYCPGHRFFGVRNQ